MHVNEGAGAKNFRRRGVLHAEEDDEGAFSAAEEATRHRKKPIRAMVLSFS